jgi:hypothetical protein
MGTSRSPSYPNTSLSESISKARQIYQKEHMSTMTPSIAAEAMLYAGINGASLKTIASLKKWGLLEGRADELRLTKDAQTLAIDEPDSPDYQAALLRCANAPDIFSEISKQFPGPASERNIAVYLEKRGFIPDAASTVARHYKDTLALVSGSPAQYGGVEEKIEVPVRTTSDQPSARLPLRFYGGGDAAPLYPSLRHVGDEDRARPVGDAGAPFRITMDGKKLHIIADVDLGSLQTLKQVLESYETVLKLLQVPAAQVKRPPDVFVPGEEVPASGNYWASHPNEHVPAENVSLNKGDKFPHCKFCGNEVIYKQRGINENSPHHDAD